MSKHILHISQPAQATPIPVLPDGAITGNGDVTAVLAGTTDRIRIHIGKADFWKADGRAAVETIGGLAPLGLVEILLPHLVYADYHVEQNMDEAYIKLSLTEGKFSANLKITVCAEDNVVLFELDRTYPAISVSLSLLPLNGSEAVTNCGSVDGIQYAERGFDTPACKFPSHGICAIKQISRAIANGRERIVWAMAVATNHDAAAYKSQTFEKLAVLNERDCNRLLDGHKQWWADFWSKSGVELPDEKLELYWYAGLYAVACCARNKKFPPGIWGVYATADGMGWFGDYHLNYNYQASFYALASSNHTELLECYSAPLNEFLPVARRYAKEYLGIDGAYFPVAIGPMGMETDVRPDTKEHGHLFLGQKSNGVYATVVPMMHWYATRDTEFAKREYYDVLLSVAEFWENYLVYEDGVYEIYHDSLHEVAWWCGPDYMPNREAGYDAYDKRNQIISCLFVKNLMALLIDLSQALGCNTDKIEKWQHIWEHLAPAQTVEFEGMQVLQGHEGDMRLRELTMEGVYPAGAIGKHITPHLFEAAQNTHKRLAIWDSGNRFCSYYPAAARLGCYAPQELLDHIHETINRNGLPNGMFRFSGGGLENSSAIPSTINEMLLQSYEGIVRLFPMWEKEQDVAFHGLRAKGAFVIDANLKAGKIHAEILSEQGMPLTLEVPSGGCVIVRGDGQEIIPNQPLVTIDTAKGEKLIVRQ